MADALLHYFRKNLPAELASLTEPYIANLENGKYSELLHSPEAQALFGLNEKPEKNDDDPKTSQYWTDALFGRLGSLLADRSKGDKLGIFFCIGYAALLAFLQSNVTGPPLDFTPTKALFPADKSSSDLRSTRAALLRSLSIDGIAPYKLTPHVELLCVADAVMTCPPILKTIKGARWAKLRVAFVQQRILSELSSTLQNVIYDDLTLVEDEIRPSSGSESSNESTFPEFLVERATIDNHHGLDKFARDNLERAKQVRRFDFALTGLLGKRTKFQEKDFSQLVVLAKSDDGVFTDTGHGEAATRVNGEAAEQPSKESGPKTVDLDDDTLLESISFTQKQPDSTQIVNESALPSSLAALDPSSQPQLQSVDSAILLALASSITNTSPEDGLTREETLPYATRVLEGGSANWQVYTQALLVRSRIEGYKARTVERGLLQLQALVDQVIAETAGSQFTSESGGNDAPSTTFLPRAKESESAPVTDRLRYIFLLASPTRWDMEAELAARWTSLGGLRSALEIYERLEMWAEAALCWAATEREDKARKLIRKQLFYATGHDSDQADGETGEDETWSGSPRQPPPADAPRLYCILGDIDQSPEMYEKAWELSNQRYARAQRSLGRHYFKQNDFVGAAAAYSKSLKANQLNHSSWFALGCALLELDQFDKAAEAFSRCVQLDETDAESWSNLAAALLRKEPEAQEATPPVAEEVVADDEDGSVAQKSPSAKKTLQNNRLDALNALKRAAALKHDSFRIWENVLIVAASVNPPDFNSLLAAQRRLIGLRGATEGERCLDVEILALLVAHIMAMSDTYDPSKPGIQRMAVKFIDEEVTPLITGSSQLWRIVSKLALWRGKPSAALDAEEKAWRVVIAQPGWETESEQRWDTVVEATVRLCDAYESLGQRERTEGMGAGTPVAKDWKFKARTAVRGILGRGKASWEGTRGWDRLKDVMEGLKG